MQSTIKLALATLAVTAAGLTANANPTFDGRWSVEIHAQAGHCDQSYRVPISVANGQINYAGNLPVRASGIVDGAGSIAAQLAHGSDVVQATGQLGAEWGRGEWNSSTLNCSGTWLARRG